MGGRYDFALEDIVLDALRREAEEAIEEGKILVDGNWQSPEEVKARARAHRQSAFWSWVQFLVYCSVAALFGFALLALTTLIV